MININGQYTLDKDSYQWILCDWGPELERDGGEVRRNKNPQQEFYPNLQQVGRRLIHLQLITDGFLGELLVQLDKAEHQVAEFLQEKVES